MKILHTFSLLFARWRPVLAGCLFAVAAALLWSGFGISRLLPLPSVAVADTFPADYHATPPASILSKARAHLLQSSVDSVALGLSGALASLTDETAKREVLAKALNALTFELGEEVYFTAWQGTRILHSPLTPDTMNMDFADALDERGSSFVRAMGEAAAAGGFVQVTLPRQMPPPGKGIVSGAASSIPLYINADDANITQRLEALSSSIVSAGQGVPARVENAPVKVRSNDFTAKPAHVELPLPVRETAGPVMDSTPVAQVVYVRLIPSTTWHIAAFMPTEAGARHARSFSSAWAEAASAGEPSLQSEDIMRQGLCVSGFSVAGLAGVLLVPGLRRREETREEASR